INECDEALHNCTHKCNNFDGGFNCSCPQGYNLNQAAWTCIKNVDECTRECRTNMWGVNCSNECQCTGQGADYCDPVKGCICLPGWIGTTCSDDINECNRIYDVCEDVKKHCENNLGSYVCNCIDGFAENDEGLCKDIDECSNPLTHNCDPEIERCVNTTGGFTCECVNGYTKQDSSCEDIDECTLKTSGCEQMCENKPGSYNCFCYFGYKLNDDRKTCKKVDDPCKQFFNKTCGHYCVILKSQNKTECRCSEGYRLMNNEVSCEESPNVCGENAICNNLEGSFQCKCQSGTRLQNDGITCA
ncbi:HMCN1-like protein, partial [Mya arenaria]